MFIVGLKSLYSVMTKNIQSLLRSWDNLNRSKLIYFESQNYMFNILNFENMHINIIIYNNTRILKAWYRNIAANLRHFPG